MQLKKKKQNEGNEKRKKHFFITKTCKKKVAQKNLKECELYRILPLFLSLHEFSNINRLLHAKTISLEEFFICFVSPLVWNKCVKLQVDSFFYFFCVDVSLAR